MVTDINDGELIARIVTGDTAAFEKVYNRYAGHALAFALSMIAEHSIAEEIVQEAFWRVWKRSTSFNAQRGSFPTWLLGIIHHLVIDELRRRRGQAPLASEDLDSDIVGSLPADDPDIMEQVEAGIQRARIREALEALSDSQRVVIELAFFQGYTHQEIAAKLQEPIGTIHTRARLALTKLRIPYERSYGAGTKPNQKERVAV